MRPEPYAPPKAEVKDLEPEALTLRIRTKSLYLAVTPVLIAGAIVTRDALLLGLTLTSIAVAAALTVLLTVLPLREVLARRSGSLPWWWDISLYALAAMFLLGASVRDPTLIFIGLVPILSGTLLLALALWVVEAKYRVRAYSKMRGIVFVHDSDGL